MPEEIKEEKAFDDRWIVIQRNRRHNDDVLDEAANNDEVSPQEVKAAGVIRTSPPASPPRIYHPHVYGGADERPGSVAGKSSTDKKMNQHKQEEETRGGEYHPHIYSPQEMEQKVLDQLNSPFYEHLE